MLLLINVLIKLFFLTFICNTLHKKKHYKFQLSQASKFYISEETLQFILPTFFSRLSSWLSIDWWLIDYFIPRNSNWFELFNFLFFKAICTRCDEFICGQVANEQTPVEGAGASIVSNPKEPRVMVQIPEQQTMVSFKYELMISISLGF